MAAPRPIAFIRHSAIRRENNCVVYPFYSIAREVLALFGLSGIDARRGNGSQNLFRVGPSGQAFRPSTAPHAPPPASLSMLFSCDGRDLSRRPAKHLTLCITVPRRLRLNRLQRVRAAVSLISTSKSPMVPSPLSKKVRITSKLQPSPSYKSHCTKVQARGTNVQFSTLKFICILYDS